MDKFILERINKYFNFLIIQLLIPKGYHNLNINYNKKLINISLTCLTNLRGINKLIPYLNENFFKVDKDIILLLRKNKSNKDYILHEFYFNEVDMKLSYKEIINYLSPYIIPMDVLKMIADYLKNNNYLNLIESLNFYNYEHLLNELTGGNVVLVDHTPQFKDNVNVEGVNGYIQL